MDSIKKLIQDKREEILKIAANHGAYNVRLFGSVARGEATLNSDVDFLVELEPKCTLLDQIALIQALENLLGCSVDVAEPENLHELLREQVLKEAIPL